MYSEKQYGLVFSGGGGKGAFQIGVWKALEELKIADKISIVSGSSVGALNALLFSQGTYEQAVETWLSVDQEEMLYSSDETKRNVIKKEFAWLAQQDDLLEKSPFMKFCVTIGLLAPSVISVLKVFSPLIKIFCKNCTLDYESLKKIAGLLEYGIKKGSAFTQEGLAKIIDDFLMISDNFNRIPAYVTICRAGDIEAFLTKTNAEYICLESKTPSQVRDTVLASSALPLIYPKKKLGAAEFYDGGWADNVPIKPLYELGIRDFIVIYLENNRRNKLEKDFKKEDENFPDTNIIRVIPDKSFSDGFIDTITVSKELSQERMEAGYKTAMKILSKAL